MLSIEHWHQQMQLLHWIHSKEKLGVNKVFWQLLKLRESNGKFVIAQNIFPSGMYGVDQCRFTRSSAKSCLASVLTGIQELLVFFPLEFLLFSWYWTTVKAKNHAKKGTIPTSFRSLSIYIYICIYAQTGTFADPTVQRFELFFPFECGVRFFFGFQEAFSSCGSSQSSASGWKAFEGLTFAYPSEQATRYSFSAVSTSKSPGQRCSLAAASNWTRFFVRKQQNAQHCSFAWDYPRSSPFRSTLNTGYITGLGMCKVCTEAVHSVALWTRVTLQVWACVKYVPKQSIA